jgi:hypothetical protein
MESNPLPASEPMFTINLETGAATPLTEVTLQSVGLRERQDLQRWVTEHPEIVGSELLLVTTEFDQWELRGQRVADRLDVLFLDSTGALLVAELKRDQAGDTTDLQALKYAAYCDQLTLDDLSAAYAKEHATDTDAALAALLDHAPAIEDGEFAPIRIRLVAGSFGPSVTTLVLWLRDRGIDIGCTEVTAHLHDEHTAVLTARQLLPLPEAEDYLVRRRRKEKEEETRRSERRKLSSVAILTRAGVLREGDTLPLRIEAFSADDRPSIEAAIEADQSLARATWTGLGGNRSLRWDADGDNYSPTRIVVLLRERAGLRPKPIPGPDYWTIPSTGRSMYEESKAHEASIGEDAP